MSVRFGTVIFAALAAFSVLGAAHAQAQSQCVKPEALGPLATKRAFVQTRRLKDIAKPLVSRGMAEPIADGVLWRVTEPVEIVTRITPKGVFQSVEGGPEETVASAASNDPFLADTGLVQLLRGDLQQVESRYESRRSARAGKTGWRMDLTPKSEALRKFISSVTVEGCATLDHVGLTQANGDRIEIDFANAPG